MASVFSSLFKGKKEEKSTKDPEQVDKTSNESVKQELRELSFEEGEKALKPKNGLVDKVKGELGLLSELHGSKAGSKKSGDKLQGLMSSSHAKRAAQLVKVLSQGVSSTNAFHAVTSQLMGGDMEKLAESYQALSENNETLRKGLFRVFSSDIEKWFYLESILDRGEPDLRSRMMLAAGKVTGAKASQTALMKLVEDADPSELDVLVSSKGGDEFFNAMKDSAKEWLGIFEGKGKRILAAVKGRQAELALDKAVKESGADSKDASEAFAEVVKQKGEHLCEIYHQRWSNLSGLGRKGMADDLERICARWDDTVRKAVVAKDQPFHQLLVKEMASLNVFIRTGAGTAAYLLNLVAGTASSSDVWFAKEENEKKSATEKDPKDKGPKEVSKTPIDTSKSLELDKDLGVEDGTEVEAEEVETEGELDTESELDSEDLEGSEKSTLATKGSKGSSEDVEKPGTEMVGSGPMAVLRELERKKQSRSGIKHLKLGYFMKWKTLENKVSALDDHERLEILVSLMTEDERMEMFDPEADPKDVDMLRSLAIERLRDTMLKPAGMSGETLVSFMGAFKRGASKDGHRSSSPYGRLKSLVSAKLKPLDFSQKAIDFVSQLEGGEIFEVVSDKALLEKLKSKCQKSIWQQIALILNVGEEGGALSERNETSFGRKVSTENREDVGVSGQEARQHAADMAELRPEHWAMKLSRTIIGGIAGGQRHQAIMVMNGALKAAERRQALGKKGEGPHGFAYLSIEDFCQAVLNASSQYSVEDLKKDDILGPAMEKFAKGRGISAAEQIRAGLVDQPYAKTDDLFMTGKTSRLVELVNQAKGKELLMKWSNYQEWFELKQRLKVAQKKEDGKEKDLEVKTLEDKMSSFTLDVNAEVQDETRLIMTTSRRVAFLDVVRNRLADAMAQDEEFRDTADQELDMGRFSQERTRTLGALDGQQLEDSTAQWSMLSGSDVRKESRDMLVGRVRTGYETLRSGKKDGKSEEAKKEVDTKQSDKVEQTRTELKERTADFVKVRNLANTVTTAVVGAVVGALFTAIATGVTAATFGGAAPVWAAMLFAAGAAVGTASVNLALEKALKGDQFNATEALAQAAMKVVVATATAGTGPFAEMLGGSLAGMKDLGSLVAMAAIKATIRSVVRRGIQSPLQFAKAEEKGVPWVMLGQLGGFVGDVAGGVAQTALGGGLKEIGGLARFKDGEGNLVDHLGQKAEKLTTLEKVGGGGISGLGAAVKHIPGVTIMAGTAATRALFQAIEKALDKSTTTETDKGTGNKEDEQQVVGWRTTVRMMSFAAGKKADTAKKVAQKDKNKPGAGALAGKAEALSSLASALTTGVGALSDVAALEEMNKHLAKAVAELDKAVEDFEKGELVEEMGSEDERVDVVEKVLENTETKKVEVKL